MNENLPTEYGIYQNYTFSPLTQEQLDELVRKTTPAFPAPKSSEASINKTKFIRDLLISRGGELTAREIAQMVVDKFGGDFEKALSFTRAVPYHLKQKGIIVKYKKESEVEESVAVPAPAVSAATIAAMRQASEYIASVREEEREEI